MTDLQDTQTAEPNDGRIASNSITKRIIIYVFSFLICLILGFGISRDMILSIYPKTTHIISSTQDGTEFDGITKRILSDIQEISISLEAMDEHLLTEKPNEDKLTSILEERRHLLQRQSTLIKNLSGIKIVIAPLEKIINILETDITNMWLFIRAFFTGGLGALASMLMRWPNYLARVNKNDPGDGIIFSYLVLGGVVSLVAFGLFYTKEISIFTTGVDKAKEIPEFWRMTVLCILSGAFAFRLFESADERVKDYLPGRKARPD